jgi:hypothetical protein
MSRSCQYSLALNSFVCCLTGRLANSGSEYSSNRIVLVFWMIALILQRKVVSEKL